MTSSASSRRASFARGGPFGVWTERVSLPAHVWLYSRGPLDVCRNSAVIGSNPMLGFRRSSDTREVRLVARYTCVGNPKQLRAVRSRVRRCKSPTRDV